MNASDPPSALIIRPLTAQSQEVLGVNWLPERTKLSEGERYLLAPLL